MSWLGRLFGDRSWRTSSSLRSKGRRRVSSPGSDGRKARRERSRTDDTERRNSRSRARSINQQSGQTFSNAFTLAKRELPGIREADAAFVTQRRRRQEPEIEPAPQPRIRKPQQNGRGPGLRRPN